MANPLLVGADTSIGLTQGTKSNAALDPRMISDLKALGIRWLRWQPYAYSIEKSQGVYTWGNLDSVVSQCNTAGINLMLTVLFPPAWGISGGFPTPSWSLQFAQAMASRYDGNHGHGSIQGIEIGNEDYTISGDNPTALAASMNACYHPLKTAYPNLVVGSGCCIHRNKGVVPGYYQTLWQKAPAQFDYINFHFYTQNNNSSDPSVDGAGFYSYDTLIAALQQANSNAGHSHFPIWITETGWPVNTNGFTAPYVVSPTTQSNYLKYVLDKSKALSNQPIKIFLYTLAYFDFGATNPGIGHSQGMSLYQVGYSGNPTPAYTMVAGYPKNWGGGSTTATATKDVSMRARLRVGTATHIRDIVLRAGIKSAAQSATKDIKMRAALSGGLYDTFQRFPQPQWGNSTGGDNWIQGGGSAIPSIVFASSVNTLGVDSFARANVGSGSWGTATDGQSWSVISGAAGVLSVVNGHGLIGSANSIEVKLGSHTSANFDIRCRVQPNDNSDFAGPMGRFTDVNNWYWLFFDAQFLFIKKRVAGSETTLASPAISYTLGNWYWMRFVGIGSTLMARWWADGLAEPATWDIITTDTSLSSAAGIGFLGQSATATSLQVDSFTAIDALVTEGQLTGAAGTNTFRLGPTQLTDAESLVRVSITQAGDIIGLTLRDMGLNNFVRLRLTASQLQLTQQTPSGGFVALTNYAFVPSASTFYWLKFRAQGTLLQGKIWADGTAEPANWLTQYSPCTVVGAGQVGVSCALSQVADIVLFDHFSAVNASTTTQTPNSNTRDVGLRMGVQARSSTQTNDVRLRAGIVDLTQTTIQTYAAKRPPLQRRFPKS